MTDTPKIAALARRISAPSNDFSRLPRPVAAIREKILATCAVGDIEALRIPIDWNEVRPMFERGVKRPVGTDPIEILKSRSFDGKGREILVILRNVLNQSFVRIIEGPFESYVFPSFAVVPPDHPDEGALQAQWSCVRFADLAAAGPQGGPLMQSAGFGADGVWHYFWSQQG